MTCFVCGKKARLGEKMCKSCLSKFNKITSETLRENKNSSIEYYWTIKVRVYMRLFSTIIKNRDDYPEIYNSIVNFYENKGFISKKQLEVVLRFFEEILSYSEVQELDAEIQEEKEKFFNHFQNVNYEKILQKLVST